MNKVYRYTVAIVVDGKQITTIIANDLMTGNQIGIKNTVKAYCKENKIKFSTVSYPIIDCTPAF